jgi:hypothetical protein
MASNTGPVSWLANFGWKIAREGRANMTEYTPSFPEDWDCEVVGFLYDAEDPADLSQDMLEVTLPNGFIIDAGWVPDGDQNGCYVVTASYGLKELLRIPSKQLDEAMADVYGMVERFREYGGRLVLTSVATIQAEPSVATWQ